MSDKALWVVAGALEDSDARWLMHQRPEEKAHGGLWEFPGGKVEPSEMPVEALVRELHEELGIVIDTANCLPLAFAEERQMLGQTGIVILLYKVTDWLGSPEALEGGGVGWFTLQQIEHLEKPPLDEQLTAQLFEKRK